MTLQIEAGYSTGDQFGVKHPTAGTIVDRLSTASRFRPLSANLLQAKETVKLGGCDLWETRLHISHTPKMNFTTARKVS